MEDARGLLLAPGPAGAVPDLDGVLIAQLECLAVPGRTFVGYLWTKNKI